MATEEGSAQFKTLFDALDKDRNGRVSKKEWGEGIFKNRVLLAKYFGGASLGEIGAAFARLDADGSGDLTWKELRSGGATLGAAVRIADGLSTPDGNAELRRLFESIDSNSDGKVTSKEWGEAVSANKQLLAKYFLNGQCDGGDVTLAELGKTFNRLDTNKSGDVTWDEWCVGAAAAADVWWVPA